MASLSSLMETSAVCTRLSPMAAGIHSSPPVTSEVNSMTKQSVSKLLTGNVSHSFNFVIYSGQEFKKAHQWAHLDFMDFIHETKCKWYFVHYGEMLTLVE